MPITSDGKEPNLTPFLSDITKAVSKAVNATRSPKRSSTSIKQVVLDNLDDVIALVSSDGKYRFNQRQLLYALRPIVRAEIDQELKVGNFTGIITDYEAENGEILGMYREPRGSIYHPHRKETITLGTLMVENYKRPEWNYIHLLYCEKEGFNEALKDESWPERHDAMLISSKGFTSRAARDLIDRLAEHDEPVKVFCVHDADAYGTSIYQTFQEETKARGARKIEIINLGLEPWEAVEMGLEVEDISGEPDADDDDNDERRKTRRKPVADYVHEYDREHGTEWADWLQTHRVELNAMTTEQFIEWLDVKMAEHGDGKLIPPPEVLEAELAKRVEAKLREDITGASCERLDWMSRLRPRSLQRRYLTQASWPTASRRCSGVSPTANGVIILRHAPIRQSAAKRRKSDGQAAYSRCGQGAGKGTTDRWQSSRTGGGDRILAASGGAMETRAS